MPQVSVIIPVWNGANYLAEAIESVLQQNFLDKEVIVVNDGSTDATSQIIAQFGSSIRSITQHNKGLGASRNTGVLASHGKYIAFLDHDDLWEKTKLTEQMQYMIAHAEEDPLLFSQVEQFICSRIADHEKNKIVLNKVHLPGYTAGTILMSRARFEQIGYFRETKEIGEFIEWYQRALEKNVPTILLDSIGLRRRLHLSNMGRQIGGSQRIEYLKILKASLDKRRQNSER